MHKTASNNLLLIESPFLSGSLDWRSATSQGGFCITTLLGKFAQSFHSYRAFHELADRLISLAEHAYYLRDIKTVQEASLVLMNLPLDAARQIGQYYQALALKKNGKIDEAQSLIESVADNAPLSYRARAIQTLGTFQHEQRRHNDALRLYVEAARAASHNESNNLLAYLMAQLQVSFIQSDFGDHQGAIAHLQNLWPLVRCIAAQSPFYFYVYHADLAYELSQVGRAAEAEAACAVAITSPFAHAYPEWSETRDEIAAKRQSATPSVVAINRAQEVIEPLGQRPSRNLKPKRASAFSRIEREETVSRSLSSAAAAIAAIARCAITHRPIEFLCDSSQPRAPPTLA